MTAVSRWPSQLPTIAPRVVSFDQYIDSRIIGKLQLAAMEKAADHESNILIFKQNTQQVGHHPKDQHGDLGDLQLLTSVAPPVPSPCTGRATPPLTCAGEGQARHHRQDRARLPQR